MATCKCIYIYKVFMIFQWILLRVIKFITTDHVLKKS